MFQLAGKRQPERVLDIRLTREGAYEVLGDGKGELVGRVFESFE